MHIMLYISGVQDVSMEQVDQQQSLVADGALQDTQSDRLTELTANAAKLKDLASKSLRNQDEVLQSAAAVDMVTDHGQHHFGMTSSRSCIVL